MKENSTITKPHLVENFTHDLMSNHKEQGENIIVTKVSIRRTQHNSNKQTNIVFRQSSLEHKSELFLAHFLSGTPGQMPCEAGVRNHGEGAKLL